MNSLTHRLIVQKVYRQLQSKYGVRLAKGAIIWGSIKPDFTIGSISHIKDDHIDKLYKKWDDLCQVDINQENRYFSRNLGVILHFLCDYFCYAHNHPILQKVVWSHYIYERKLYQFAKKVDNTLFKIPNHEYDQISFPDLLEYKHQLYLKGTPSFSLDLNSAFEICMIVSKKLIVDSERIEEYTGLIKKIKNP